MARVLIAGCGDIGAAAGRLLVDDGNEVVGLKRNPPSSDGKISYVKKDITNAEEVSGLDTEFDLVICILTPDDRSEQAYRRVFEVGIGNLCRVFSQRQSSARFLFISSTSVYGQMHGEWVDEASVTEPESHTGRIILQAENTVLSQDDGNCIIRFSGIYGRGRSHLLTEVTRGGGVQYRPPYYTNRIHRSDCVAVVRFIAVKMLAGERLEPVYLASDDDPAPKWEVFNYLAGLLGEQVPEKKIMADSAPQNKRCSNRRLKQLGYDFIYNSYRDGYADTV